MEYTWSFIRSKNLALEELIIKGRFESLVRIFRWRGLFRNFMFFYFNPILGRLINIAITVFQNYKIWMFAQE